MNLIGKQKDVVDLPDNGHFVVLGTAGSGKTTMALLRAKHLGNKFPNERVLLVTFNKALISYMRCLENGMPLNVDVRNYHHFARGYLDSRNRMSFNCIVDADDKYRLVESALENIKLKYLDNSTLRRPVEDFLGEINFIQQQGFDENSYLTKERIGRASVNIKKENRKYFFEVYKEYLQIRALMGKSYDWEDIATAVEGELKTDGNPRYYTHIVLDEGQDFSPQMLRSLIAAIPSNGSFIFFGDVNQQIYGSRLSWRDAGISIDKSRIWKFSNNFRNSKEIALFAAALTASEYWQVSEDAVVPSTFRAAGPLPNVLQFNSEKAEISYVCERAQKESLSATVAIIVRDRADVRRFTSVLRNAKEIKGEVNFDFASTGIYVTTYHSSKGLEFDYVFVPFLNSGYLPDKDKLTVDADKLEEVYFDEIKLLYVAITRAKFGLVLSYYGSPSCFIPKNNSLYSFHSFEV